MHDGRPDGERETACQRPVVAPQGRTTIMQALLLKVLSPIIVTLGIFLPSPPPAMAQVAEFQQPPAIRRAIPERLRNRALQFARTELFFGTAMPDGAVTEEQFLAFLDAEVTPRFPDGLTLLKGLGQFTGEDGVLVKEQSYVLVLLYPLESLKESHKRIEAIRRLYKGAFNQESVLRVDDQITVRVSF